MDKGEIYLAEEIIRNILKRLPVKSLIRFQCVCQLWKTLIKRPSFTIDHLQYYSNRNPSRLLQFTTYGPTPCVPRPSQRSLHLLDCDFQVREFPKPPLIEGGKIVGSCNGLLLVENIYSKNPDSPLLLWNPATASTRFVHVKKTDYSEFCDWVTGFVFSPTDKDYKIVRLYAKPFDTVSLVEVFSLRRGSWKGVHVENLEGVNVKRKETVMMGGVIFWIGVKGMFDDEVIVSFDTGKEAFTLTPAPILHDVLGNRLTIYENKLALLYNIWKNFTELWVLEEGSCASGKTWRWSIVYTGSPFPKRSSFALFTWRNEIFGRESDENNVLYFVNLPTNEVKRLVVPCHDNVNNLYDYVESLVSVYKQ